MTTESGPAATAPIPVVAASIGWRDSLVALRLPNYRLYLVGQVFANSGGQMAGIALDWLILELSHDVALVGLAVTLGFLPTVLLGPWAGVVSDRFSRRRTLIICMSASTLIDGVLAVLALSGTAQVWEVLGGAAIGGVTTAIDQPSRAAFIAEMVGTERLGNAIALTAVVWQFAGLLGPGISGLLIAAAGSGWSIAVSGVTTFISVAAVALMRRDELFRARAVGRHGAGIRGALAYIGRKPTIIWCLLLLGVVSVFSMNQGVLLSAMAAGTFHSGAAGYGLYSAMSAVGALVGAALAARYPRYQLRVIVLWTMLLGAVTMAGAVPVLGVFLPAIVAGGALQLLFTTSDETLTQLSARAAIRGRIMAFFLIVTFGGRALGGLLIGQVAQQGGPQLGFLVSGAVPLLAGAVAALVLFRLRPEIDHPLGKGDAS